MNNFNQKIAELSPTKRSLLEQRLKQKAAGDRSESIPRITNCNSAPLSFSQARMWFLNQLEPGNPAYNRPTNIRLKGLLNIAVLEQSLNEIVRRHEVLRTTFPVVNGQTVAVVAPTLTLTLPLVNLSSLSTTEREAQAKRIAVQEAQQVFNLSQSPLFKATILRLSEVEHILLLTMHHIIFDGWSQGVLLQELAQIYEAFSLGKSSPLPELPIQYTDFAHWQRQQLQGEILKSQLAYWKKQLSGSLPVLELPTDRPRPAVQTFHGAKIVSVLPLDLSESLKALSQQQEVTLFMMLLAAFKILLHRYTGQDDILVGSPIAGRNRIETEKLIGVLINTLVLRTHIDGKLSFRELLAQVREVALQAYAHQDIPFEKLVEELQPERHLSHTPLFQVMFQFRNLPNEVMEFSCIQIEEFEFDRGIAQFDLSLDILDTPAGLTCKFEYNTDLFDAVTIKRMSGHFQTLLEGIVANPNQCICDLPMLTVGERHQLLVEWNNTNTEYPHDQCIHQLFEAQVERTPDAVAVVWENQQLTYSELNTRANQLAHYLQTLGVQPEVIVGICIERSLFMAIALLGILKAGGAYLPLDPTYPQQRLAFMLSDAQPRFVLTQQHLISSLPKSTSKIVSLDAEWQKIAQFSPDQPSNLTTPENLAYIIYTSGSTGIPKGVMITHQSMVSYCTSSADYFNLTCSDRVLQFASLSFDISIAELFPTWISGATVVLRSKDCHSSIQHFREFITTQQMTILRLPTAFWQELVNGLSQSKQSLPSTLRLVTCGGEKVSRSAYQAWCQLVGNTPRWFNCYGPTETTVTATIYDPQASSNTSTQNEIPIGQALAKTQIYILDSHLQPVPIGVTGELYIGGVGVARGYLNSPDLTLEKFIPNPFSHEEGARLYKTGDLARYLSNGQIEFVGRIDHQVKIRGFRIELGEIETVLSQHPVVLQTVVIAREDVVGDKRLVAYIVVKPEQVPSPSELRGFLKEQLPEYMIPVAFVFMNAMPLTPNGKVDRGALPAPDTSSFSVNNSFVEPRNSTEEVLAAIWAKVLGLEKIGIHDNFFELGGHSLLGMQLISQASQAIGVGIPLRLLFEKQTIALFATAIEAIADSKQQLKIKAKISPLQRLNSQPENIPLSASQLWSWSVDHPYITTLKPTYYIVGSLNVVALEQSLNEIVRRHEILRTTFPIVDGKPVQVIAPTLILTVPVIDLRELSGTEKAHKSSQLFESESLRPFDLQCGPLIRTQLLHVGQQEYLLSFFINHIIFDGISLGVFMGELSVLYNAFDKGLPSGLAELPFQFADFVQWQQQYMSGEVKEFYDSYWKQKLANAQPIFEPSRELGKFLPAFAHSFELSTNLINSLREMGRKESVSLFIIMLTAFKLLLHTYTGKDDIVVGVLNANRHPYETKFLIGFFANRFLLRTNLSGNPSFRELLVRVRDFYFESYDYQSLPDIQSGIPEIDHAQVFFNFIPTPRNVKYSPFLQTKLVNFSGAKVTNQDLVLNISEEEDRVNGKLAYTNRLFDAKTIEHLVNLYCQILEQVVEL